MNYSTHKIKPTGHIELREVIEETDENGEVIDSTYHRSIIAPNQPVEKYNEEIEADEDFVKYRTQENADAYEAELEAQKPTAEDLEKQIKQRINQEAEEAMKEIKEELLQEMVDGIYAEKETLTDEEVLQEPKKVKPYKIGVDYVKDERFYYPRTDKLYKVLQDHTSAVQWLPDEAVSLYVEVTPEEVIADWVQPTGAHDAYDTGAKVNYGGQAWVSQIDANTTVPDGDEPNNRYWKPETQA